jgi:hypothetical protein
MTDAQFIPKLVEISRNPAELAAAKARAEGDIDKLEGTDYYPRNSCAITQYWLFKVAGIDLGPSIYGALAFVETLIKREWRQISVADVRDGKVILQPGDIGTTCYGGVRHPGSDHVYQIGKPMSEDEALIIDNQRPAPHFRYFDTTGGVSPTTLFLRAPA